MKSYTDKEVAKMKAIFERVEDKANWKNPINAIIVLDDNDDKAQRQIDILFDAIIFFTGSVPTITRCSTGVYRVRARGPCMA